MSSLVSPDWSPSAWWVAQWAFEDAAFDAECGSRAVSEGEACAQEQAFADPESPDPGLPGDPRWRPLRVEQLLAVDGAGLSAAARVDHLVALEAVKSRLDAARVRVVGVMAAAVTDPASPAAPGSPGSPAASAAPGSWGSPAASAATGSWGRPEEVHEAAERDLELDVRLALRVSSFSAAALIAMARTLCTSLPGTLAALDGGALTVGMADAVCAGADRLPVGEHARLEGMVLPRAGTQTRGELTRSVHRAVLRVDPAGADRRHTAARAHRRLVKYPELDGMASLVFHGPAGDVATVYARVDAAAHLLPTDPQVDARCLDEKRADVFIDALLAGLPVSGLPTRHGRAPAADVTVALSTLLGFDEHPGDLGGYGPIPASMARDLATDPDAIWRRVVTDPVTGCVLDYGRTTYRPPVGLRDYVTARDRTCVAPGCAIPARRCDLDHIQAWDDGGPTSAANLAAVCGIHHDAKTRGTLTYHRDPDGGYTWTTHTGHHYRTPPRHDHHHEPHDHWPDHDQPHDHEPTVDSPQDHVPDDRQQGDHEPVVDGIDEPRDDLPPY